MRINSQILSILRKRHNWRSVQILTIYGGVVKEVRSMPVRGSVQAAFEEAREVVNEVGAENCYVECDFKRRAIFFNSPYGMTWIGLGQWIGVSG